MHFTLVAAALLFSQTALSLKPLEPSVPIPFNPNAPHALTRRAISVDSPLTVFTNGGTSNVSSNALGDHLQDMSSFTDAYNTWEKYGLTQPYEYWHMSPEAVKESNTTAFYESFIVDYHTKDSRGCKTKGLGEFRCFGWVYTGDQNFICNIDTTNMCRKPSSLEVMTHIDKHWGNYTIGEKVELGRQAYFASEVIHTIMAKDHRLHELLKTVETHALADTVGIVQAFTPQVDGLRVAKCEIANVAIQLSLQAATMAAGMVGAHGLGEASKAIEELAEIGGDLVKAEVKVYKGLAKAWANINTAVTTFWPLYSAGTAITKPLTTGKTFPFRGQPKAEDLQEYYQEAAKQDKELPELMIQMSQAGGMCGNNFGVVNDDNISHISKLTAFVVEYMTLLRARLDRRFRTLFIYQNGVPAESSLATFMKTANQGLEEIWNQDLKEQEHAIAHSFHELLASKLLSQSRSYLKCEERADAVSICAAQDNPKNPKSNASRYCPAGGNMRCQMERWTKQETNNHADFVPPLVTGGFDKYGMTAQQLMQNSWQRYLDEKSGNMSSWTDMNMQGEIGIPKNQLYIPVCVSKVKTIEEIREPKMWKAEEFGWRTGFPFSCGGWRSEETSAFLKSININPTEERDLWKTTLARYLNRIPAPANRYLLLCTLGIRYPSHTPTLILNSHSPQCLPFLSETANMNEWESNFHFCTSDTMRKELKSEYPWLINVVPNPVSHKRLCRRWMRDNEQKIGLLGEEARRKFGKFLREGGEGGM